MDSQFVCLYPTLDNKDLKADSVAFLIVFVLLMPSTVLAYSRYSKILIAPNCQTNQRNQELILLGCCVNTCKSWASCSCCVRRGSQEPCLPLLPSTPKTSPQTRVCLYVEKSDYMNWIKVSVGHKTLSTCHAK